MLHKLTIDLYTNPRFPLIDRSTGQLEPLDLIVLLPHQCPSIDLGQTIQLQPILHGFQCKFSLKIPSILLIYKFSNSTRFIVMVNYSISKLSSSINIIVCMVIKCSKAYQKLTIMNGIINCV
jgi:hypothetical protein